MADTDRLSPDQLEALTRSGRAVTVVDVRRDPGAYAEGHVPGARCIPVGEIVDSLAELPKDELIVTY